MVQADFEYGSGATGKPLAPRVSVFGGRPFWREETLEDLQAVGCRAGDCGDLSDLIDGPVTALGDVVIVEVLNLPAASIGALVRLNERVAAAGSALIVLTSLGSLDAVFSIFDRASPQILVDPTRAELMVAIGRAMPGLSSSRLRELTEQDRSTLVRLAEQVEKIARELDRISSLDENGAGKLSDFKRDFHPASAQPLSFSRPGGKEAPASLPDPKRVRRMIAARQARARFFDAELFSDPAWDMLLDLTAAHAEKARVSVTSLCIAANVPATTALRWLKQMVESGIFERVADANDRRRAFIELSESSRSAMARYFDHIDAPLARAA